MELLKTANGGSEMEENRNDNVNVNFDETSESGGLSGKLIAGAFALGAGAFALGQTVGAKIGNPVDAIKKANAKHKIKKADRKLKKLQKKAEKLKTETEKLEVPVPEGTTPASEEAPKEETK